MLQSKVELVWSALRHHQGLCRGLTCTDSKCQKALGARQQNQSRSCCSLQKPVQPPDAHTRKVMRTPSLTATCSAQSEVRRRCVDFEEVEVSPLTRKHSDCSKRFEPTPRSMTSHDLWTLCGCIPGARIQEHCDVRERPSPRNS